MKNFLDQYRAFFNLELSAKKIVEGSMSGLHKSPFHGFSTEFLERRPYNSGESTRFLDWKYLAKTDKKFVKIYEEETNLRCHIILDVSSSMYYPEPVHNDPEKSKIGFATLLSASLMHIMQKQRDAIGLSFVSDKIDFYSREKTNRKHFKTLLGKLEDNMFDLNREKKSMLYQGIHDLAERFHKRSLIVVISDFVDSGYSVDEMFKSLKHISFDKHEIILFHLLDQDTEVDLSLSKNYTQFIDIETSEKILLNVEDHRDEYKTVVNSQINSLRLNALKYKMDYQYINIREGFERAVLSYLTKRKKIF